MVSPRTRVLVAILLLFASCCITTAKAQTPPVTTIPSLMNFQGRLAKPDGTPVADGTYTLTFRIYSALSGGTKKWEQSINPVLVRNGVFSVLLGNGNPLDAGVFNGTPYLEVQVANDAPLAPRQPFVSVSFAFKANTVPDGAIGSAQLGDGAVTSSKIQDSAVTNSKIAAGAITGDKILDGTIGSGKLAAGATAPSGPAGGDLTGNYPNPIIAAGKVDAGKLALDGGSLAKVSENSLTINNGRLYVNYGTIQHGGAPYTGTTDMGLYNLTTGWMRFVTTNSSFQWFSDNYVNADPIMTLTPDGELSVKRGLYVRGHAIQDGGDLLPDTSDLGLYSSRQNYNIRNVTTGGKFLWFSDGGGGGNALMTLDASGTLSTKVLEVRGSDIAEPYHVAAHKKISPKPGMVVSIDPQQLGKMRVSSQPYDRRAGGIISGANGIRPGVMLRQAGTVADGKQPVASIGRVWCWCDADEGGPIEAGDLLTTSSTPGHAMRVRSRSRAKGATIGKAMSSLKKGKGLVFVLVTLQ